MLGTLTNIPTDTLIDMLYVILAGGVALNASDVAELEQIQRELQRRGDFDHWMVAYNLRPSTDAKPDLITN